MKNRYKGKLKEMVKRNKQKNKEEITLFYLNLKKVTIIKKIKSILKYYI